MFVKSSLIASFALFSSLVIANDYITLSPSSFELKATRVYDKINDLIQNPEPVLQRYNPVGMKIKNKVISKNQIQFLATKDVLGVSKTVLFKGTLDITYVKPRNNKKCFQANLDFTGSGGLIIDNIENLEMTFCTDEKNEDHLMVAVNSRLLKGNRYGGVIGTIAKNLIADQVMPIITSIKEEIETP